MAVTMFLAIGHGRKSDGTYDPGAVHNGLVEHDLASRVVAYSEAAFRRSVLTSIAVERDGTNHEDPNFVGSVVRANTLPASRAAEIHFNAGGGTGTEVWISAPGGQAEAWAKYVAPAMAQALGLPNRGVKVNPNLVFVSKTKMPAILVEVAFVDGDNARIKANVDGFCRTAAEAFVKATCSYLTIPYVPPVVAPSPTDPCPAYKDRIKALEAELEATKAQRDEARIRLAANQSIISNAKAALGC